MRDTVRVGTERGSPYQVVTQTDQHLPKCGHLPQGQPNCSDAAACCGLESDQLFALQSIYTTNIHLKDLLGRLPLTLIKPQAAVEERPEHLSGAL